MAYALSTQGQGASSYIALPSSLTIDANASSGSTTLVFEIAHHGFNANGRVCILGGNINAFGITYRSSDSKFAIGGLLSSEVSWPADTYATITLEAVDTGSGAGTLRLLFNGAEILPATSSSFQLAVSGLGIWNWEYSRISVRRFSITDNLGGSSLPSFEGTWNSSSAPATGTVWPSVSGGLNLTITGATGSENSWWIFYSTPKYLLSTLGQGTNSYIVMPNWQFGVNVNSAGVSAIEITFKIKAFRGSATILGATNSTQNQLRVEAATQQLQYRTSGNNSITSDSGAIQIDRKHTVRLEYNKSTLSTSMFLDGVLVGSPFVATNNVNFNQINRLSTGSTGIVELEIYSLSTESTSNYSSYLDRWDATTAPAFGTDWVSTSGTRNLTVTTFTGATDTWWHPYEFAVIQPCSTLGASVGYPCNLCLEDYISEATSFSILSGTLPTGLTLSGNKIIGTPTAAQQKTFVLRATNGVTNIDTEIVFTVGTWRMRFNGTNQTAKLGTTISGNLGTASYSYRVKGKMNALPSASSGAGFLGVDTNTQTNGVAVYSTGAVSVVSGGIVRYGTPAGFLSAGQTFDFTVQHDADGAWTIVDNLTSTTVASGTFTISTSWSAALNNIGRLNSTATVNHLSADIELVAVTGHADFVLDANLCNASGRVLRSTSGSSAYQAGPWPLDNSEWVNYAIMSENKTGTFSSLNQARINGVVTTKQAHSSVVDSANFSTQYLYQVIYGVTGSFSSLVMANTSLTSIKTVNGAKNTSVVNITAAKTVTKATNTSILVGGSADLNVTNSAKEARTSTASTASTSVSLQRQKNTLAVKPASSASSSLFVQVQKNILAAKPVSTAAFTGQYTYQVFFGVSGSFSTGAIASLILGASKEVSTVKQNSSASFGGQKSSSKTIDTSKPNSSANFSTYKQSAKSVSSTIQAVANTYFEIYTNKAVESYIITEATIAWRMYGSTKDAVVDRIIVSSNYYSIREWASKEYSTVEFITKQRT